MARKSKEQRALDAARQRRAHGDPLPFMMILRQERSRRGLIAPVDKTKRNVDKIVSGLLC